MNSLVVAFENFEFHRFSVSRDFFGFEIWGTIEGYSYEMVLDRNLTFIDFETYGNLEDKKEEIYSFLRMRIIEGVRAGVYENDIPVELRYF